MTDYIKQNYAHGAIVRIKLENFVTYDSLEFSPGPNLNVVIGPNGTGKSTIVCAICLGMAGKPTVLARASNLADYIKYGKNRAIVEIELVNTKGRNFVIKREIFKDNRSEWFLNGKIVKLKEIEELVMDLNIQVGNLCQFLPQERVTEFARMNPQQLLESTEKAVGGNELFQMHTDLKDQRELSKTLERDLINIKDNLKKEETINARLENQVKSFLEKKKFEENILILKKKRSWVHYSEKKKGFEVMKTKKDEINIKLQELDRTYEPLREKKGSVESKLNKDKANLTAKSNVAKEMTKQINSCNSKRDDVNDKVVDAKNEYQNKEAEYRQRKTKIKEIKDSIHALKSELEDSAEDLANIKKQEADLKKKENEHKSTMENSSRKEHEIRRKIYQLRNEREELIKQIQNLQNVRYEKLQKLRKSNYQHTIDAIEWIEQNRTRFNANVYEPMILLINMKTQEAAKYVENLIPKKDLNALFLFEDSGDMDFFLGELRNKRRLVVHAALVPRDSVDTYRPSYDIRDLKFGFQSYIREAIDAPDAILRYLCLYQNIHSVPYGDKETQTNIKQIIPQIKNLRRIYTSSHQYSFNKSRYSDDITSVSMEVPPAYYLTSSVDSQELNEAIEREKQKKEEIDELEKQLQKLSEETRKTEKLIEQIKSEQTRLRERMVHIQSFEKKIQAKELQLEKLSSQKIDIVEEAKKKNQLLAEYAKKRVSIFNDCHEYAKKLMQANKEKVLIAYTIVQLNFEFRKCESELRSYDSRKQEFQREIENHASNLKQAKDEALQALQSACKTCEIKNENELPNELKAKFAKLPNTVDEIDSQIHEIEAKAQCSYDVDKQVVDDFNERKKRIEQLQKECEKKESKLNNHKNNFEKTKNDWNDQIESMMKTISEKFSVLFRLLKCSGEVSLARPDNPEDFSQYGTCIKVSFRNDEKMQELTAWQQSGGEKSVATMLYMIALQEMTKCPFRVVDEINQGMDPVNERKVFDIIVKNSSLKTSAQYFLLTPKLLPNLEFEEKTKVICVFNGPHNLLHSKYNLKDFIEKRKKLNETAE